MRAAFLMLLTALTASAQGINAYGLEKEAALGVGLAAEVHRNTTALDSATVLDYVNRIGNRLSAQILEAPFPYTFAVISDDRSNPTHEPLSLPGGYIFVPGSLILAAQDEAEFAGMLAHSMVHVSERHSTRQATRGQIANPAALPLIFVGGWTSDAAAQLLAPVGMLKFQLAFETEADTLAVAIASGAGFDPSGLIRYIGRVQPSAPGTTSMAFAALPPPQERVSSMQIAIQALPQRAYRAPNPDEFGRIQAEVRAVAAPVPERPQLRPSLKRGN